MVVDSDTCLPQTQARTLRRWAGCSPMRRRSSAPCCSSWNTCRRQRWAHAVRPGAAHGPQCCRLECPVPPWVERLKRGGGNQGCVLVSL
jgi:hypothetical protein